MTTKCNIDCGAVCDGNGVFQVEKVSKVFVHSEKNITIKIFSYRRIIVGVLKGI